ncbi:hypothetical protein FK220_006645 [Flavobacteriaceae bacterium TP-CH-4]|uniref:Uncharacterized protein n=1 Tax=Pelagihabitans pacificus TaxID=2696054 RepID=A0A967E5W6_9FLAO|nr:hypothetical protein [Pelagihabitans pacificus]NHF59010.1 hypothetical protein [Pelagihabitans pacificus]
MKLFYSYPIPLTVFFFLIFASVFAQNDYQKGYVITLENDTLWGYIKDRKPTGLLPKIRFKGNNMKKRFGPTKIIGYQVGDRYYESIWVDKQSRFLRENVVSISGKGERIFLRLLEKGKLVHYILEFQDQGEQLVQEIDYFKKEGSPQLIRVTQGLLGLKRKRVMAFLRDCPSLTERIERKTLKHAGEIASYYNNECTSEN